MNPKLKRPVITVLFAAGLIACSDKNNKVDIAVTDIPAHIIATVQNALPGISLSEAEKEIKNNKVIYQLEGKLINGKEYEIKISEDGTIIKIELED